MLVISKLGNSISPLSNSSFNISSILNFGFFRTNLCRYLFKNANTIFERLNEEL